MVSTHGLPPYETVLLGGGPAANGALHVLATRMERTQSVLYPTLTATTVQGQVLELSRIVAEQAKTPVSLVGHSFGAILALLFAAQYPDLVRRLVLVGCPPLNEKWANEQHRQRCLRLSPDDQAEYEALVSLSERDVEQTKRLIVLTECTDTFERDASYENPLLHWDYAAHEQLGRELARMRKGGVLEQALKRIDRRIFVLHGEHDPSLWKGVTSLLADAHCDFITCKIPLCGHSPYLEKFAAAPFLELLTKLP